MMYRFSYDTGYRGTTRGSHRVVAVIEAGSEERAKQMFLERIKMEPVIKEKTDG